MNVREYLSVRRAYALVRQGMPYADRLTFEELAILCHLSNASSPLRTSEVAEYQGVLRPTMTHRTSHLARLGLIERTSGERDRRSVCCALSQEGRLRLDSALLDMCASIKPGMPLSRCTPDRMRRVVDTMGSVTLSSADLVLGRARGLPYASLSTSSGFFSQRSPWPSRRCATPVLRFVPRLATPLAAVLWLPRPRRAPFVSRRLPSTSTPFMSTRRASGGTTRAILGFLRFPGMCYSYTQTAFCRSCRA